MSRTFVQQDTQIYSSPTYNDALAAGSTLQSGAANLQDDLNGLRSQMKRVIHAGSAGNWYDAIPFPGGSSARGIEQLATDLYDIEQHKFLFRASVLTDITVPGAQNWVVLTVASNETPTEVAAVGAGTANGAVVASLAGSTGAHALTAVSGANVLSPKNLCLVIDGSTGQPLQASTGAGIGKDVYGLLQAQSGVVDGDAFTDSTKRVQISFVTANATDDALIAAPVVDVAGKSFNYAYARRLNLDALPEQAFLSGVFVDQTVAGSDVTLDRAVDSQVGAVTQTDRSIDWRISNTYTFKFQNSAGGQDFFSIAPTVAGTTLSTNVTDESHATTNPATFNRGLSVATASTQLNLGTTAGQIDSSGALTLASNAAANIRMLAANEIYFDDVNQTGSTWADTLGIKLSDTTAEWDNYKSAFGEVSLLSAVYQARNTTSRSKTIAVVVPATIAADVNVTGAASPNLDAQLGDYSARTFTTGVDIFLNGVLLRNGANSGTTHDVYPGTSPANGDLKFKFGLKGGATPDVITMILPLQN